MNDTCFCGSGKKNKNCCRNKQPSNEIQIHKYLPPRTTNQAICRHELEQLYKNINEPHCKICGDTEKESKIVSIPTQVGDLHLCEFCYRIQRNMRNK